MIENKYVYWCTYLNWPTGTAEWLKQVCLRQKVFSSSPSLLISSQTETKCKRSMAVSFTLVTVSSEQLTMAQFNDQSRLLSKTEEMITHIIQINESFKTLLSINESLPASFW